MVLWVVARTSLATSKGGRGHGIIVQKDHNHDPSHPKEAKNGRPLGIDRKEAILEQSKLIEFLGYLLLTTATC